jgi:dTDP-4-dehydrorhamnose 3,5-epimerase
MKFMETYLKGAYVIELEPVIDERGFFARNFCFDEFHKRGLDFSIAQCNISYNKKSGTIRGMHRQVAPHQEIKLVRCTRGVVYDVIIDLRPESPTFEKWFGIWLGAGSGKCSNRMVYVPKGFAHGYLSITDESMIQYMVSESYHPECERAVRWDDPAIGIRWPNLKKYIVSEKDSSAGSGAVRNP